MKSLDMLYEFRKFLPPPFIASRVTPFQKRSRNKQRYVHNGELCHTAGKLPKPVKRVKQ